MNKLSSGMGVMPKRPVLGRMGKLYTDKIRSRKGFTITELLLVVGIVVILCSVGAMAVFTVNGNLRQKELDSKAQIIYEAAQNQLNKLSTAGSTTKYVPEKDTGTGAADVKGITKCANLSIFGQKSMYYVTSDSKDSIYTGEDNKVCNCAAKEILPKAAVDDEIRNHNWIIEYDPGSASVVGVFYTEDLNCSAYDTSTWSVFRDGVIDEATGHEGSYNRRHGAAGIDEAQIGYYGGDILTSTETGRLQPKIKITNGEILKAEFSCENVASYDSGEVGWKDLTFDITFYDGDPKASGTHSVTKTVKTSNGLQVLGSGNTHEWILDNIMNDSTKFAKQMKNLGADSSFKLGTPLYIKLVVSSASRYVADGEYMVKTNGLFSDDSTTDTAYIRCGRHLQNLDTATSGVSNSIKHAIQKADITFTDDTNDASDWATVYQGMRFTPILNEALTSYNGTYVKVNAQEISKTVNATKRTFLLAKTTLSENISTQIIGLNTVTTSTNSGLFRQISHGTSGSLVSLNNIRLVSAYVTGTQNAGALIGEVSGNVQIKNCSVYIDGESDDLKLNKDNVIRISAPTAGGLIGAVTADGSVTVDNSFASTVIGSLDGTTYAGGIAGTNLGSLKVNGSYSDCYLKGANCAGITCNLTGTKTTTFENCYTVGYINATTVGCGMVYGTADKGINSYTALVYENLGATIYTTVVSGTLTNVYYLSESLPLNAVTVGSPMAASAMTNMSGANLGNKFTKGGSGTTSPYNFRTQLTTYPYPRLVNIEIHYGDWETRFTSGQLVYYEKYSDGTYGYSGASGLDSTLKDVGQIVGDGYGLIYDKIALTSSGNGIKTSVVKFEQPDGTMSGISLSSNQGTMFYVDGGEHFIIPFDKSYVNPVIDATNEDYWTGFYQKVEVDGVHTYYYNPYFTQSFVERLDRPSSVNGNAINIRTARQLNGLSKYYQVFRGFTASCNYNQLKDINYMLYDWIGFTAATAAVTQQEPIGNDGTDTSSFVAVYNGGGHIVTGFSVISQSQDYVGLFGYNMGIVQDVVMACEYTADATNKLTVRRVAQIENNDKVYMGVIAGFNGPGAKIRNCAVAGYILTGAEDTLFATDGSLYVGGLVGRNLGWVTNCSADTPQYKISANNADIYVAGFAGYNGLTGTIRDCYALGNIKVVSARDGKVCISGFAGSNAGLIQDSYCATSLVSSNKAITYGFSPKGGMFKNCRYLDGGTYQYINKIYSYNNDRYHLVEKDPVTGKETVLLVDTSYEDLSNTTDKAVYSFCSSNTPEPKEGEKAYPFRAVVKTASGTLVHYGDWTTSVDLGSLGFFYWEKETGETSASEETSSGNSGIKISFIKGDNTIVEDNNDLCDSHDDGGFISNYGYGYFVNTNQINNVEFSVSDVVLNQAAYRESVSSELGEMMNGYTFYAYETGSDMYISGDKANAKAQISYTSDGVKTDYNYEFSPFFADAMQFVGYQIQGQASVPVNQMGDALNLSEKYMYTPGTNQNPYSIRSLAQFRYINWNSSTLNTNTIVSADAATYQKFNYLAYAQNIGVTTNPGSTGGQFCWNQTHDIVGTDENGKAIEGYTPIAAPGTSSKKNDYDAILYTWFAGTYDGQSYTIKNVNISSKAFAVGLFGVIADTAKLQNIVMYGDMNPTATIERYTSATDSLGAYAIGGLVGIAYDKWGGARKNANRIYNCAISGYDIIDNSGNPLGLGEVNVGGLVGIANGELVNCSAVVDIVESSTHKNGKTPLGAKYGVYIRVGGLVGAAQSDVVNCYTGGSIDVPESTQFETYYSLFNLLTARNRYEIYLGGVVGSAFASNFQNFSGTMDSDGTDGHSTISNCYTYMTFPTVSTDLTDWWSVYSYQQHIQGMYAIGGTADRGPYSSTMTINNCYYLDTITKTNSNVLPCYPYDYKIYDPTKFIISRILFNGGTVFSSHISRNGITAVSYDQMSTRDVLLGIDEVISTENGASQSHSNFVNALNSFNVTEYEATAFGNVTIQEVSGSLIDGKYSFPGNMSVLEGKNYPFPTSVTQPDPNVTDGTVNVHYGAWPVTGLNWAEGRTDMDLLADVVSDGSTYDGYAVKEYSFYYSGTPITRPDFQFTYSNAGNDQVAEIVPYGTGTLYKYDEATGTYTVKVKALQTGSEIITVTDREENQAQFRIKVNANLTVSAYHGDSTTVEETGKVDASISQNVGDSVNLRLVAESDGRGNGTRTVSGLTEGRNAISYVTWRVTSDQGKTSIGEVIMDAELNTAETRVTSNKRKDDRLTVICTYHYNGHTYDFGTHVDITAEGPYSINFLDSLHPDQCVKDEYGDDIVQSGMEDGMAIMRPASIPADTTVVDNSGVERHYSFVDWYSDQACTQLFDFDHTLSTDQTVVYAGWQLISRTVSYYSDGVLVHSQTLGDGDKATSPGELVDNAGIYTFEGWYTGTDYLTKYDFSTPVSADIALYAKWTWKVQFYINSTSTAATGEMTDQIIPKGSSAELKANVFKFGDNTFVGWDTSEAGTGTPYYNRQVITDSGKDLVLYAQWKEGVVENKVTIHPNNGTSNLIISYETGLVYYGPAVPTAPDKNHGFVKWYLDEACENPATFPITLSADVNLYAKWEEITRNYTIILHPNNNQPDATITPCEEGMVYNSPTGYTKEGYDLFGWYSDASCKNKVTFPVTVTSDMNLYAKWKLSTKTVTIHYGNGSNDLVDNVTYGTSFNQPVNPTWSGRTFTQWYRDAAGTQPATFPIQVTDTVDLYAGWSSNNYTVKFNGNGAESGVMADQVFTAGDGQKLSANTYTRTGYVFNGWGTKSEAQVVTYQDQQASNLVTEPNVVIQLYAIWTPVTVNIVFHKNASSSDTTVSQTVMYDQEEALRTNSFSRSGYAFIGWNENKSATTPQYRDGEFVKNLASTQGATIHLYAVWYGSSSYSEITYSRYAGSDAAPVADSVMCLLDGTYLTINPNGGTCTYKVSGSSSQQISSEKRIQIQYYVTVNNPVRSGYSFWGWKVTSTADGNTLLTAQWHDPSTAGVVGIVMVERSLLNFTSYSYVYYEDGLIRQSSEAPADLRDKHPFTIGSTGTEYYYFGTGIVDGVWTLTNGTSKVEVTDGSYEKFEGFASGKSTILTYKKDQETKQYVLSI